MTKAGFLSVFLGIENVSTKNLRAMRKPNTVDLIRRGVAELRSQDIVVIAGLINGLELDDPASIRENYEFVRSLGITSVMDQLLTPYPKTPLRREMLASDRVANLEDFRWYDGYFSNVRTSHLSSAELNFVRWKTRGQVIWMWRATRADWKNFKGYTYLWEYGLRYVVALNERLLEGLRFADEMEVDGVRPDPAFRQQGNLFVLDEASRDEAYEGYLLQKSLGCEVHWLTPEEVKGHFPIYNLKDCVAGAFGPLDGTMSPIGVLAGYKKKVVSMGAKYMPAEAAEVLRKSDQVAGVRLSSGGDMTSNIVMKAAGPWAADVARTAGVELPVAPTKRQVTIVETGVRSEAVMPVLFLPSGLYVIHEGEGLFMVGKSFADDYIGTDDFHLGAENLRRESLA